MVTGRLSKLAFLLGTSLVVSMLVAGTAQAATSSSSTCSVTIVAGKLTMQSPTVGDIAPLTLDGAPKSTTVPMTMISVTDATGTGMGWHLTVQATPLATADRSLSTGSMLMSISSLEGTEWYSEARPAMTADTCPIDTQKAVLLADASPGESGMGAFQSAAPGSLTLNVPADAEAGVYESTMFLSLITGP